MSTRKMKTETGEEELKNKKNKSINTHNIENLSLKYPSTDYKEIISEDLACQVTDQNDDQFNENCFHLIGEHENQIADGGEADLHTHLANCKKNPGHREFIPIESFSLKHLPEGNQDNDLYQLIKASANLTVRISVNMTSPNRPEFWPKTNTPYFLSDMRGNKTMRAGTGRVNKVMKYTDKDKHKKYGCTTCPCDKCKTSDKPSKVWWEIYVDTATHVVFDDIELGHTTLRLFYDREDSPLVILKDKICVDYADIARDRCMFTCVTCDENFGIKLEKMVKHYEDVWWKVEKKYVESRDIHKLNFIVSHPHGCSKQVSVGQWKDIVKLKFANTKFTYTTCTCPGSSGAYVHYVGYGGWYTAPVHSGSLKPGLNFSGVGVLSVMTSQV